jgi:CheY-like chemotaxis protein
VKHIPHVLVVDADDASRQTRHAQLSDVGFRVSTARTGFEAIVKASCQLPDMIVLDDALTDLDAIETGRLLTMCPSTAHIPVLRLAPGRRVPRQALSRLRRIAV